MVRKTRRNHGSIHRTIAPTVWKGSPTQVVYHTDCHGTGVATDDASRMIPRRRVIGELGFITDHCGEWGWTWCHKQQEQPQYEQRSAHERRTYRKSEGKGGGGVYGCLRTNTDGLRLQRQWRQRRMGRGSADRRRERHCDTREVTERIERSI